MAFLLRGNEHKVEDLVSCLESRDGYSRKQVLWWRNGKEEEELWMGSWEDSNMGRCINKTMNVQKDIRNHA